MTLKRLFSHLFKQLIDGIVPPRKTERRVEALTLEGLYEIIRREKNPVYAPEVHTLLPYHNTSVKALVWEIKYYKNAHALMLGAELLQEELLGACEDSIGTPLLLPVPMHEARKRERGYNQTEVLCETILDQAENQGATLLVQYEPAALMRTVAGTPQQKLARAERLTNMKSSMCAEKSIVKGRHCIVLDDVSTTGATLMECRRALRVAGAKGVYLIALAG